MSKYQPETRSIFGAALELKIPEERACYLDEACKDQPELRQRVESLLLAHEQANEFLETEDPTYDGILEGPGDVIDRYKLLEEIGEGGFGVVFMAEQIAPIRRRVALKIVKPGMDTKQVIARFEAERQALALMDHPNIAHVFDAGSTESGRPYFVMELIHGVPLTQYCDDNKLTPDERLKLFLPVCDAVQHAHQKGIIHRDLKPSNVLITLQDGKPVPKVIDFGTAKALHQPLTEKTMFTAYGKLIGTPQYMSPEQAEMSALDVDTRADIYSLGVLLYELLTGTTPFEAEQLRAAAFDEMMRMIREKDPPKPSTRVSTLGTRATDIAQHRQVDPDHLRRSLTGDLDCIAMKALEKDRQRRYCTVYEFYEDIERHLGHQPVMASPPSAVYQTLKFIRRHRTGVALASTVAMTLVAGLIVSIIGFAEARKERDRAIAAETVSEKLALLEAEQRGQAEASAEIARVQKEAAESNWKMAQINQIQHHLDSDEMGPAMVLLEEQRPFVNMEDSRSLEWRHLWWRAHQGHRYTLRGHEGNVNAVAFIPNQQTIVSAGCDGTVRLWDMGKDGAQTILIRQQAHITCVAVSPDAETLAWGDREGRLVIWDLPTGLVRHTIHTSAVRSLAFSPDSRLVAAGSLGSLQLWNTRTGERVGQTPTAHVIPAVAFSPDGRTLACGNISYGEVTLLDVENLRVRAYCGKHRFWIKGVAFSPDGQTLVSGGNNPTIILWDINAAREQAEVTPSVRSPSPLALSPDGTMAATGGDCGTIEVIELRTGKTKYYGHAGAILSLAFSPDGSVLASTGQDGSVKLWDIEQEQNPPPLHGRDSLIWSVNYSPDGKLLATGGDPQLWEVETGRRVCALPVSYAECVVFSHNGKFLAGCNWMWDIETGKPLPSLPSAGGLANTFSPDDQLLIEGRGQGEEKGQIRIWDWRSRKMRAVLDGHSSWVFSLAVSPDSKTLASASSQGTSSGEVILWDMDSGRRKQLLEHGCACVTYSPDGKLLATGSKSGGIALWDPDTGELLQDMVGHVRFTEDLAFATDGKTILSCNVQGSATLWDVEKGIERATLSRKDQSIYSIAIAPDGRTFATGGWDGKIVIWRTASEADVRAQSAFSLSNTTDAGELAPQHDAQQASNMVARDEL